MSTAGACALAAGTREPGTMRRPSRPGQEGMTARMLAVSWDTVRLFLHVFAAAIWVGGQLTLAALVPVLRRFGAEVPRAAAGRFNQVAWTAFAVLVITGVWNIVAVRSEISRDASYRVTLIVKLIVVGVSGITAALQARARSTMGLAVFGALTGDSALAALFLGVLLAG
ncbi:MAG: cation transporting ATPase C-terminal domain-containing protein [Streptosporangiaceae bacterium]